MPDQLNNSAKEQLTSQIPSGEKFRQLRAEVRSHLPDARKALEKNNRMLTSLSESQRKLIELSIAASLTRESKKQDIDPLTGVLTKSALLRYLNQEAALQIRLTEQDKTYPSTIVMADLNGLKAINDSKGHTAGDIYIREFAALLSASVRSSDYVGKFGGDEFVLLLRGTEPENAKIWLDHVMGALGESDITASFGLHTFDPQDVKKSIDDADTDMYINKEKYYEATGKKRRT